MKRIITLKKAMSLFLCILLTASVMITAGAAEDVQTEVDTMKLNLGSCYEDPADDGMVTHHLCVELIYTDISVRPLALYNTFDVTVEAVTEAGTQEITDWQWDNAHLISAASMYKAEDGTVIVDPYCFAMDIMFKTNELDGYSIKITAPFDYAAVSEQYRTIELTDPIQIDEPEDLAKIHVLSGDADGNGRITANDAMKMMRYSIKLDKLTDEQLAAADVNGDGKVNAKDSLATLRYTIGFKDQGTLFTD